jgi:energy-coupling factor transporter transmembrane protein EcfT
MLSITVKLDTWFTVNNPKISMLFVLFCIVASIVWTNIIYLAILTLALYLIGVSCRFPWKQIAWFLQFALIASLLILIIQAFTSDDSLIKPDGSKRHKFYVPARITRARSSSAACSTASPAASKSTWWCSPSLSSALPFRRRSSFRV